MVYDAFYLQVGPSEATETVILTHFLLAGFTAISVVLLAGDYLTDRLNHRIAVTNAIAVLVGLIAVFLLVALLELASFLTAILVLATAVLAVPLLLRYRYGVRSGGIPRSSAVSPCSSSCYCWPGSASVGAGDTS